MSGSRKLLIISGVVLAIWGMSFGLYYALFAEHQALDKIGGALATGFTQGAQGDLVEARASLQVYADTQFVYVRSVDVHSHWIGLAIMLIVFGVAFDRVGLTERRRMLLASYCRRWTGVSFRRRSQQLGLAWLSLRWQPSRWALRVARGTHEKQNCCTGTDRCLLTGCCVRPTRQEEGDLRFD